jgi:hypothetical protein
VCPARVTGFLEGLGINRPPCSCALDSQEHGGRRCDASVCVGAHVRGGRANKQGELGGSDARLPDRISHTSNDLFELGLLCALAQVLDC